jgi:hypothetical protein
LGSLKKKLLAAGLLNEAELERKSQTHQAPGPSLDKRALAQGIADSVRSGLSDAEIMKKFGIPASKLPGAYGSLIKVGYLTQEELERKAHPVQVASQPDKRLLAQNIVETVRKGLCDAEIMKKFGIPASKLPGAYSSLIKAGYLTQEELERRGNGEAFEETVDLIPDSVNPPRNPDHLTTLLTGSSQNQRPTFKWLCPACQTPHPEEYAVCPQCGIIVEKYKAKLAREQQCKGGAAAAKETITPGNPPDDQSVVTAPRTNQTHSPDPLASKQPAENVLDDQDKAVFEKLAKLQQLVEAGILSEEECHSKRYGLLRESPRTQGLLEALDDGIITEDEFQKKLAELTSKPSSPIAPELQAQPVPANTIQPTDTRVDPKAGKGLRVP